MKKILLAVIAVALCSTVHAQSGSTIKEYKKNLKPITTPILIRLREWVPYILTTGLTDIQINQ